MKRYLQEIAALGEAASLKKVKWSQLPEHNLQKTYIPDWAEMSG